MDAKGGSSACVDGEEELSLESFFICEDYKEKCWRFGDVTVPLLQSNMSSTDHDLTGQIVWPASLALSCYLVANPGIFRDKVVLELGAGCGLAGFTAVKVGSKSCVITDGNDVVMRLLDRNKNAYYSSEKLELDGDNNHINSNSDISSDFSSGISSGISSDKKLDKVYTRKLLWGLKDSFLDVFDIDGDNLDSSKCPFPDVIIGADVVLWPTMVSPLVITLKWLLLASRDKRGRCYISYVVRAKSTTDLLFQHSLENGLLIEEADPNAHITQTGSEFDSLRATEKRFFIISLLDPSEGSLAEELSKVEKPMSTSTSFFLSNSAPC